MTLDKQAATAGRVQYHLRLGADELGPVDGVLLPGDPDRVGRIAARLEDPLEVAHHREYRTAVGTWQGARVAACSTGIGCPSAAIAVEELANAGARTFVRVGSTGALQPGMAIGDLVVSTGSMKNEGTSRMYLPDTVPAVPDLDLTVALVGAARAVAAERSIGCHVGLGASDDAFYGESPDWIERLAGYGLLNLEMEASAIYTVAHLRGLRAGMVCAVSGNLAAGEVVYEGENTGLVAGWEAAIEVALRAVAEMAIRGSDPGRAGS